MPARRKQPAVRLLFADSERNADMRYFSGFMVPDPFVALEVAGTRIAVLSALEIDRARKESHFDEVLSLEEALERARKRFNLQKVGTVGLVRLLAAEYGARALRVPADFPAALAFACQEAGLKIEPVEGAFFPARETKTEVEAKAIAQGNGASAAGIRAAERALRRARIGKNRMLMLDGRRLSSERLRTLIDTACLEKGAVASHTICAGGDQACDPHCAGSGPLRADSLIIIDVFPRVSRTGYHGDMTRTFLKGRASEAQKALVATVAKAQGNVLAELKAGISGKRAHAAAVDTFTAAGYETTRRNGRFEGFFHGTGHGLGLEVHEAPRLSSRAPERLKKGAVVTVEPGLYYPGLGGCRIEDVALIESGGYRLLSKYPYRWHLR